jgi:hypothetical protein
MRYQRQGRMGGQRVAYTDELEPLIALEQELRQSIALRIALENGAPPRPSPTEDELAAADEAIAAWAEAGEDELDPRAFRPAGPLQALLADHQAIFERILDIRDRRLS